jgi:outer membrane protein assembly factor BamB
VDELLYIDQVLYIARHNTDLTALNTEDRAILWTKDVADRNTLSLFGSQKGIYLTDDKRIIEYQPKNGAILWKVEFPTLIRAVSDGINIYTFAETDQLILAAYNASSKKQVWVLPMDEYWDGNYQATFLQNEKYLYYSGKRIIQISKSSGAVRWENGALNDITRVIPDDATIFVQMDAWPWVYCLDQQSGGLVGKVPLSVNIFGNYNPLTVSGNVLYLVDGGSTVMALVTKE